jgi:hypothetical protein
MTHGFSPQRARRRLASRIVRTWSMLMGAL